MAIGVGLGTAVMGMVGVSSAVIGTSLALTITAGAIGGALIGAAIGGITSAITGGSIGKGILFGAIGGAVAGGIGAWSSFTPAGTLSDTFGATVGESALSGNPMREGLTTAAVETTKDVTTGLSMGTGTLAVGALDAGGKVVAGLFDDTAEQQAESVDKQLAAAATESDKQRALQEKLALLNAGAQEASLMSNEAIAGMSDATTRRGQDKNWDIADRQIKEGQRQYDTGIALDAASLERKQNAAQGARASIQGGVLKGNTESIDVQAAKEANKVQEVVSG